MKLNDLFESPKITYSPNQQKIEDVNKLLNDNFMITGKYSIKSDLSIDIKSSIELKTKIRKLPVQFNKVSGNFFCAHNKMISLDGCPKYVGSNMWCQNNKLTSLVGAPKYIKSVFDCRTNPLQSLDGLPESASEIKLTFDENLPLLKLLFINIDKISLYHYSEFVISENIYEVMNILNKYLITGRKGAIQCAAELTKAGFKGNARL